MSSLTIEEFQELQERLHQAERQKKLQKLGLVFGEKAGVYKLPYRPEGPIATPDLHTDESVGPRRSLAKYMFPGDSLEVVEGDRNPPSVLQQVFGEEAAAAVTLQKCAELRALQQPIARADQVDGVLVADLKNADEVRLAAVARMEEIEKRRQLNSETRAAAHQALENFFRNWPEERRARAIAEAGRDRGRLPDDGHSPRVGPLPRPEGGPRNFVWNSRTNRLEEA